MSTQTPDGTATPAPVRFHPGAGEQTVDLVPDPSRFTVTFGTTRSPLGPDARDVLRLRSTPVDRIDHYGIRVYDGADRRRRDASVSVLNAEPAVDSASPVLHRHTADGDEVYVTRRVLVRFAADVARPEVDQVLAGLGAEVLEPLGYADNGFLLEAAATPDGLGAFALAERLRATGRVVFAHPDLVSRRQRRTTTTAPRPTASASPVAEVRRRRGERDGDLVGQQWHLSTAKVTDAWTITKGSSAITVAVLDDGFDLTHPEFADKIVGQHDFAEHSEDGSPKAAEDKHGTACAGVAVAKGVQASGSAPDCSLLAVRFPAALGDSDEAEMFRWAADHGADVISCSWGPTDGTGATDPLPGATQAAIQYCRTAGRGGLGITVCWAAGNGNESVDADGYASNPHVLAIAALNSSGTRSWYSDMGAALWLTAPSSGDRAAGEKAITTTDRQGADGYNDGSEGVDAAYTNSFGGTSSATPLVAGVVGLMLSANPDLTATQVLTILRDTATKVGSGYDANGHSPDFGYGLVNAYAAVRSAQAAAGGVTPAPNRGSIVGPGSHDRASGAPELVVDPGGSGPYYAVEVSTSAALLDGGDHGSDAGFYASWQDAPFCSTSTYVLPDAVWNRLCGADRLFYRAYFTSSPDAWTDVVVTTENSDYAHAPSMSLTGSAAGGTSGGTEGGTESGTGEGAGTAGTITGPATADSTGPAPAFTLDPGSGPATYYAVEVATDPDYFDGESHTLADGFFASWTDTPFLSTSSYVLPDAAWTSLRGADRLYYRAWFSSSDTDWVDVVVTTDAADRASAPSVALVGSTERSRSLAATVEHPSVDGPASVGRDDPAPTFTATVPAGTGSWWLELATDVVAFGLDSGTRTADAVWAGPAQPAERTSYTLPDDVWASWGRHDRLYFRVATSPVGPDRLGYLQDSSTSPLAPETAPWFDVTAASRTRRDPDGTHVTDPDERLWRTRHR